MVGLNGTKSTIWYSEMWLNDSIMPLRFLSEFTKLRDELGGKWHEIYKIEIWIYFTSKFADFLLKFTK